MMCNAVTVRPQTLQSAFVTSRLLHLEKWMIFRSDVRDVVDKEGDGGSLVGYILG
jgi:hypothetical protein